TTINEKKAFDLYQESIKGGYLKAYGQLGECYNIGIGTKIDEEKAFDCYKKAAEEEIINPDIYS
ncbi:4639_t:CDS:1, partial [Dentiscutata heterogama]